MTSKELFRILRKFPPDLEIVLASDSEGNTFHTIGNVVPDKSFEPQKYLLLFPSDDMFEIETE